MACQRCRDLLSQGLDLCVRARQMNEIDRRESTLAASIDGDEWEASGLFDRHVERHNITYPVQRIATKSGTIPLWLNDQYEKDLAAWERKSRNHLQQGCAE